MHLEVAAADQNAVGLVRAHAEHSAGIAQRVGAAVRFEAQNDLALAAVDGHSLLGVTDKNVSCAVCAHGDRLNFPADVKLAQRFAFSIEHLALQQSQQ